MIDVQTELMNLPEGAEDLIRRAVQAVFTRGGAKGSACVLVTDAEEIQQLNAGYRNIDRVTDVLSFPAWEGEAVLCPPDGYLGDIAICLERAEEQAAEYGHTLTRELAFLSVHGALHLMGYDHMTKEDEAVMTALQEEILNDLGYHR